MTCSCSTCQHPLLSIDLQHIQKCHNRYISEYNYLMEDICCEHTQEYMKDTVQFLLLIVIIFRWRISLRSHPKTVIIILILSSFPCLILI